MKKVVAMCIALVLASGMVFAGGSGDKKSSGSAEKDVIQIGVLAPLTGTNAEYGIGFQIGGQMAVDEINARGGVNGRKLSLVVRDSRGDSRESSDLARQFADDDNILAIMGDFTSGACMANAPIVDEAGIVQLSPTASNPAYAGMSDYCFSIMGRQDGEAPFFARYILKKYMGVNSVGIIYINSDWGKSCIDNFRREANAVGLKIVEEVSYVQDEKDFSSLITRVRAARPDVVLIMDQGAVPQVINQIRGSGWDIPITTLGPGTSEQLINLTGANSEGLILSTPFFFDPSDPKLTAWKDEFTKKSGFQPTVHPACAYDCVYLLADAIERIGSGKITRQAIRDNLASGNFTGITGPLKFNTAGDITRVYMICQVDNGKYVVREGFDYSR